jgi:xanthine dehydrogenase YagS FAD-binding subunit
VGPFKYSRADDITTASRSISGSGAATGSSAQFLAGGTLLLDLMKLGAMQPERLVDINGLAAHFGSIEIGADGLHLGALVRMAQAADHPGIRAQYPVIAESLMLAASPQIRNMASLGGNLLQRTRCPYFREPSWQACNKREPGSGCSALDGMNRNHAVLGVSGTCISNYPGDFAQALVALGATIKTKSRAGERTIPVNQLHTGADVPSVETVLAPGELITGIFVPAGGYTRRSTYLKIRDRVSYEFALASAAVALDLDGRRVREVRIGLGGVAYRPWRAYAAEASLQGKPLNEATAMAAAHVAFATASSREHNRYKIELGKRTLVRALFQLKALKA